MKKVFVFDLDETLIDSIETTNNCFNRITQKFEFKSIEKEKFNYFPGDGPKILVEESLSYLIERDSLDETKIHSQFNEIYDSYIKYCNRCNDKKAQLYPYIRESLDKLRKMGTFICVCTDKTLPAAEKILDNLFPQGYFDYVSALEDETKRKPSPYLLEEIVEDLNIRKGEIVYFGDTGTDIEMCRNMKVTSVGVEWGSRERGEPVESGADFVISDQREVVDSYGELSKDIG